MRRNHLALTLACLLIVVGVSLYLSHTGYNKNAQYAGGNITGSVGQSPVPESTTASCHMHGLLPDPSCTPGAADPAVTQDNITQTICRSGYTKTVRPPVSYTDSLKSQQMQQYGFSDSAHLHEEDHLISLELGGAPSDPKNLWPEPGNSPNPKDKVEDFLHTAVCAGRVSLQDAQARIARNWTTAEQGL